jgi:catechol 2,3-dioxygenase-like lactoylglutathione lyase family enzyme
MEMKIELITVPVSDVDKALDFYANKAGFHVDYDNKVNENLRFIQLTPTGSACSITIGNGIGTDMKPGSVKGIQMVVEDAQAAYDDLKSRGVNVTEPETLAWGTFVYFSDPDGNKWALQQLPQRT